MTDCKKLKLLISYCMSWTTQRGSLTISESRFAQLRSQGTRLTLLREAGSVILKIAYGYTAEPFKEDILIRMAGQAMDDVTAAGVPGAFLVDILPLCKPPQTQSLPTQTTDAPSEIRTRLGSRRELQETCQKMGFRTGRSCRKALCFCQAPARLG